VAVNGVVGEGEERQTRGLKILSPAERQSRTKIRHDSHWTHAAVKSQNLEAIFLLLHAIWIFYFMEDPPIRYIRSLVGMTSRDLRERTWT
jgi:hypothetical protein